LIGTGACCPGPGVLFCARQLDDETLVAAVDTLRMLELLYRVNADVDVDALDVVDMELRQLLECVELALDAVGLPLRMLVGDTPRFAPPSWPQRSRLVGGLLRLVLAPRLDA